MPDQNDFLEWLKHEFIKRDLAPTTTELYTTRLKRLFSRFPDTKPTDISFEQVQEYVDELIRTRKHSAATIHQTVHAFHFFFNRILKKDYKLTSLPRPRRSRDAPELLTPDEVRDILQNTHNPKTKLLFSILYATGMDTSDAARLRTTDLDFKRKLVRIDSRRTNKKRTAILPATIANELADYIQENNLRKWIFPARGVDTHIHTSSIQKAFKRSLEESGITKDASPKSFRVAYIKHMERLGVPLRRVLAHLDISPTGDTRDFYDKIGYEETDIDFSPYDRLFGLQDNMGVDISALQKKVSQISNTEEYDYLMEALACFRAGALRAAIVQTWAAAIRTIQYQCMLHSQNTINILAKKHYPKAKPIKRLDDLANLKDSIVLNVARDLGVIDSNERDILVTSLGTRNKCSHPGKYNPKPIKAAAFLEDILTIVYS